MGSEYLSGSNLFSDKYLNLYSFLLISTVFAGGGVQGGGGWGGGGGGGGGEVIMAMATSVLNFFASCLLLAY